MLIHSVTPPHLLTDVSGFPEMSIKPFGKGYLEGYDTAQGFQLQRIHSTDLSMYLKSEYMPGGIYNKNK